MILFVVFIDQDVTWGNVSFFNFPSQELEGCCLLQYHALPNLPADEQRARGYEAS